MERINHNLTESLFELNALLAMCDLEQHITVTAYYEDYCVREVMSNECCRPWSLPNYVALLANRTHCYDLNAEDVAYVQSLLTGCFQYYHNLRLDSDCVNFRCKNVPAECAQYNAVYNIFHFLADNQFMAVNVSPVGDKILPRTVLKITIILCRFQDSTLFLRQAVVFVPLAKSMKILPFYHSLPV